MEQRGDELDLGGSGGEVVLEDDLALVQPALPGGALLTGDPVPEIHIGVMLILKWSSFTHSQSIRFMVPSAFFMGLAMNPKG